jgi:hypothetical protein
VNTPRELTPEENAKLCAAMPDFYGASSIVLRLAFEQIFAEAWKEALESVEVQQHLDTSDQIKAERDLLISWSLLGNDTGISSKGLLAYSLTGEELVGVRPLDAGDLGRCERLYVLAPSHLKARMLPVLDEFRERVV